MRSRVLYILENAEMGGAERATLLMVAHHDRTRYQPVVLFLNDGSLVQEVRRMDVPAYVLRRSLRLRYLWRFVLAIRECMRVIRREEISLIHSSSPYSHLIGSPAAFLAGRPCVLFLHGPVEGGRFGRPASLLPAARVVVNSGYTKTCQERISLRKWPISILYYASSFRLEPKEAAALRAEANRTWRIPDDALVLAIMARFDTWKGIDIALRAAAPILRQRRDLRFLVVGGQYRDFHPGYSDYLLRVVKEEGIERSVIFTGFQKDVSPFLARLDIMIHASTIPEPFGLTIIEAMAVGKPVIASRAGGPLEIITEGHDGLFHQPGSVKELEARIRELADNRALRDAIGARARETASSRFSPDTMIRTLEAVYDSVLQRTHE